MKISSHGATEIAVSSVAIASGDGKLQWRSSGEEACVELKRAIVCVRESSTVFE